MTSCESATPSVDATVPRGIGMSPEPATRAGDSPYRVFCTPAFWSERRESLVATARRRRARRFVASFLERFAGELDAGLVAALSGIEDLAARPDPHLDRAVTDLAYGLRVGREGARLAAVRAALQLSTGGARVEFDQHLGAASDVVWHGHLLRGIDRVGLRAEAPQRIELGCGSERASYEREEFVAYGVLSVPEIALGSAPDARRAGMILPWCVSARPVLASASPYAVLPGDELEQQVRLGVALLEQASPRYAAWCREVTTDLVPVQGGATFSMSASCRESPGQIALSLPASPSMLAELLVHECSHENLTLALEHGPLDDGSDTTLYWSPLKRTGRPIDRILLAHHALINIVSFQRELVERGLDHDGYARVNRDGNLRMIEQLESALETTAALTEIGRALYLPIREALA